MSWVISHLSQQYHPWDDPLLTIYTATLLHYANLAQTFALDATLTPSAAYPHLEVQWASQIEQALNLHSWPRPSPVPPISGTTSTNIQTKTREVTLTSSLFLITQTCPLINYTALPSNHKQQFPFSLLPPWPKLPKTLQGLLSMLTFNLFRTKASGTTCFVALLCHLHQIHFQVHANLVTKAILREQTIRKRRYSFCDFIINHMTDIFKRIQLLWCRQRRKRITKWMRTN